MVRIGGIGGEMIEEEEEKSVIRGGVDQKRIGWMLTLIRICWPP